MKVRNKATKVLRALRFCSLYIQNPTWLKKEKKKNLLAMAKQRRIIMVEHTPKLFVSKILLYGKKTLPEPYLSWRKIVPLPLHFPHPSIPDSS